MADQDGQIYGDETKGDGLRDTADNSEHVAHHCGANRLCHSSLYAVVGELVDCWGVNLEIGGIHTVGCTTNDASGDM